jgi:hypothetical protein
MYDNNLDLIADVSDYYKKLAIEVDGIYALESKEEMIQVLKTGKIKNNDGSTLTFEVGGAIDVLGNTAGANLQNVGGTMFSSADLTDNLTIDNTGFFKKGGVVSKNHRTNS